VAAVAASKSMVFLESERHIIYDYFFCMASIPAQYLRFMQIFALLDRLGGSKDPSVSRSLELSDWLHNSP
jgi:hypothetical protein